MNPISFKSTFIKPINIEKLDSDDKYKPIEASFVELDKNDTEVLQKTINNWKEYDKHTVFDFTRTSLTPLEIMNTEKEKFLPLTKDMKKEDIPAFLTSKVPGLHVYAVTTQKDKFAKLESDKILGLVKFIACEQYNEIVLLQTKPDCISKKYDKTVFSSLKEKMNKIFGIKNKENKRPYRNIGYSIVENLKEMHSDKMMELTPLNRAIGFYKKLGFNLNLDTYCEYLWIPPNLRRPGINYEHDISGRI